MRQRLRIFAFMYNLLSVAELVYFIVGLYLIDWELADLEHNPLLGPGPEGILKMGGTHTARVIERRQYWRLVTSLFFNAGAIHLMANLGMVWTFGHFLVRELSPYTVAFIFLASGLGGVLVSANVGSENMTAAASIPAFGLAGAAAVMLVLRWRRYACHAASAALVCFIVGCNAFIGATPFVDNSGNTAGLVFGGTLCVSALLVRRKAASSRPREVLLHAGAALLVVAVLAAIIGGLVGLQLDAPVGGCCNQWVCTRSPWWDCDASRIWPTSCAYTTFLNSTSMLTCPRGQQVTIGVVNRTDIGPVLIQQWCDAYCSASGVPVTGGSGSGNSGLQ
ncbi:hypothetical protein GPECTOR_40g553 [Gonium pectorale]|uniref:RHOMBOID-like protein n=1 Tax=Gonium pectorale TaxID=33097 RepID=A0A150GAF6_GONPE|nr:hypothetical protein GPECTOR_40g553 [Gonium pectorale]|eukprot:KXZ46819.1 hypothetical protein GPECTOR_40g553 [Gonium pectorale]